MVAGLVVVTGLLALLLPAAVPVALVAQLLGAVLCVPAAVLALRATRVTVGRTARAWRSLTAAAVLWGLGNVVTVVSVVLPGRGINAAIYPLQGVAMALILVALLLLPRPPWRAGDALRAGLDVAVLVLAVALVGVLTLLPSVVAGSSGLEQAFAIAYPTAALAMLGLAYALSRRHVYPPRPEMALLAAAIGAWLVGASAYALTPTALVAPPGVSWALGVGTLLLAVAAHRVAEGQEDVVLGSRVARAVLAVPEVAVVAVAVTVVLLGVETLAERVLLGGAAAVVVARHLLAAADSRRFHWRLQHEVADRTEELRDWSERYAGILDTVGDGILSTDAAGRVTYANASALRILGVRADALHGRQACPALCAQRHDDCPFDRALAGHRVDGEVTELQHGSGPVVPVELHVVPQPTTEDGGPGGLVVAFRDVSAQLAVEQVKRQFVSSVSHELRTPLTSVRGVLEMFVDGDAGELSPAGRDLVANASRGVERLSRLVDDIIDADRLATGQFRMQRARTSLERVVHDTVTALEPLAAGAGVRVLVAAPAAGLPSWPEVWADADRVEQALVNLVGNAVKFSPPGGTVQLEIDVVGRHDEVRVGVRDQGPGIPADQLEHVFERFHQVSECDGGAKGGTGLGLTITRSIVEQHGGRAWVESRLGHGALFCFTLPLAAPERRTAGGAEAVTVGR